MANALKDILGFAGKAADGLLLGGTIGASKRRNQFADYLGAGQYDEAEQLALRNGEGAYAQVAQQRAASASAQAAAEQKRQQEQFKYIQNSAAFLDSLTPDLQKAYLDLNGPALVEQGVLDEDDLPILYQNVGVPAGFTGLARSAIDPNQQQQNVFEGQRIQETGRSNRATEGLRGAEIDLSRQRLGLDRDKFGLDQRQFDASLSQKTGANEQDAARARRALESRASRVSLVSKAIDQAKAQSNSFNTGAVAGRNPFATNLDATLDTIQANIGFDELQTMRDNSKTGGALGQVTVREIEFLQAVLGNLRRTQNASQLDRNLEQARQEIIASWDRVRDAYEEDYGVVYEGAAPGSAQSLPEGVTEEDVEFTMRKYGVTRDEVLRRIGGQ